MNVPIAPLAVAPTRMTRVARAAARRWTGKTAEPVMTAGSSPAGTTQTRTKMSVALVVVKVAGIAASHHRSGASLTLWWKHHEGRSRAVVGC
jgi:hypothetical protein